MNYALPKVFLISLLLACCSSPLQQYQCAEDNDCQGVDSSGICEKSGLCSFSDDTCASGRRYSDAAGDLSSMCLSEKPPNTIPDAGVVRTTRRRLRIDLDGISEPLQNFPIFVQLTEDADLKAANLSSVKQVRFVSGSTELPIEFVGRTMLSEGTVSLWMQMPLLDKRFEVFMEYGQNVESNSVATSVWDGNYEAVYHFEDDGSDTLFDSTINAHIGIENADPVAYEDGRFGQGTTGSWFMGEELDFAGLGEFSFAFWTLSREFFPTSFPRMGANVEYQPTVVGYTFEHAPDGHFLFARAVANEFVKAKSISPLSLSEFTYVAGTYDNAELKVYINGELEGTAKDARLMPLGDKSFFLGGEFSSVPYAGVLDEVRISRIPRDADWLHAQYLLGSDPERVQVLAPE